MRAPSSTATGRPGADRASLIDAAWAYQRAQDDPRKVWYPGGAGAISVNKR
jgi:hypothetical protein